MPALEPQHVLLIDRFVPGGDGFARTPDGRAAFVTGGVPGDTIRATQLLQKRDYVRVTQFELVEASPLRCAPECAYAAECGGCDWIAVTEQAQRDGKLAILGEALRRTAGLSEIPCSIGYVASNASTHYRSRVRLHVDGKQGLGFFSAASHRLVPIDTCLVANDSVNAAIAEVREVFKAHPSYFTDIREIEIRSLAAKTELCFYSDAVPSRAGKESKPKPQLEALLKLAFPQERYVLTLTALNPTLRGNSRAEAETQGLAHAAGSRLELAPSVFTQVNWDINLSILSEITALLTASDIKTFCDLYCGNGNFSLPLLKLGLTGIGLENNPLAIKLALLAARRDHLKAQFEACDVARRVKQWAADGQRFDLVIVDPPRSGVGDSAAAIARLGAQHLFLIACDPVPFARDLKRYLAEGWQLKSVTLYDMFPKTHHFETTAHLVRNPIISP